MSRCWYVIHSRARAEARVAALLANQHADWHLETFVPMLPGDRKGSKPAAPSPLFPGYLFLRCDPDRQYLLESRRGPGSWSFVSFGGRLAVVEDATIIALRERLAAPSALGHTAGPWFRPGDPIRVSSGPLSGMEAVFEGPLEPSARARVLVEFLGRASRLTVPAASLEPGSHPPRRTRGRGRPIGAAPA